MLAVAIFVFLLAMYLGRETIYEFFCFMWGEAFEYPAASCFFIGLFLVLIWGALQCP